MTPEEEQARAILQDAPDEWGDNSFWDLLHERHRKLLVERIATALRVRTAERDAGDALAVARAHAAMWKGERDRLAERVKAVEASAQEVFECLDVDLKDEQIVHVLDGETRTKVMAPELARAIDGLAAALQAGARGEKP